MNNFLKVYIVFFILFTISCSNSIDVEDNNNTTLVYQEIATAPYHKQTTMLTYYNYKLYRFGSHAPIQVFNLITNEWEFIYPPDVNFARWDGLAARVGENIFVIAVGRDVKSYDIYKYNINSSTFEHTGVNLPEDFNYPTYCIYKQKVIFFSQNDKNVFEYNTFTNTLNEVAENPFCNMSRPNFRILPSGRINDEFYIIGGIPNLDENIHYKLNLETYNWEKLEIPEELKTAYFMGSFVDNKYLLFVDNSTTYTYSPIKKELAIYDNKIPIKEGEWTFILNGSDLYGTENFFDKVWKITMNK